MSQVQRDFIGHVILVNVHVLGISLCAQQVGSHWLTSLLQVFRRNCFLAPLLSMLGFMSSCHRKLKYRSPKKRYKLRGKGIKEVTQSTYNVVLPLVVTPSLSRA